jgi:hypothetical protein
LPFPVSYNTHELVIRPKHWLGNHRKPASPYLDIQFRASVFRDTRVLEKSFGH